MKESLARLLIDVGAPSAIYDLMFRAAATPAATLGQRLYAARRRANLTAAETANAAGVPVQLVDAVEAGEPAAGADADRLIDLVATLDA